MLAFSCVFIGRINSQELLAGDGHNFYETVQRARSFVIDSLHLNVDAESFYTRFKSDTATGNERYCYVYVSQSRKPESVLKTPYRYFKSNRNAAINFADSCKALGYDVMLYETAGTSDAALNKRLQQYCNASVAFIMLHEAVHRHKYRNKSALPYRFEEALCDLTATMFVARVLQDTGSYSADFIARNEYIYQQVNLALDRNISKKECAAQIAKAMKNAELFQRDRYDYEVNNAFLMRNYSYSYHYFLLKKCASGFETPAAFYNWIFSLKGTEKKVLKQLKLKIKEHERALLH